MKTRHEGGKLHAKNHASFECVCVCVCVRRIVSTKLLDVVLLSIFPDLLLMVCWLVLSCFVVFLLLLLLLFYFIITHAHSTKIFT